MLSRVFIKFLVYLDTLDQRVVETYLQRRATAVDTSNETVYIVCGFKPVRLISGSVTVTGSLPEALACLTAVP